MTSFEISLLLIALLLGALLIWFVGMIAGALERAHPPPVSFPPLLADSLEPRESAPLGLRCVYCESAFFPFRDEGIVGMGHDGYERAWAAGWRDAPTIHALAWLCPKCAPGRAGDKKP